MGALESAPLMTRHRVTVADYHRMDEAGFFAPDIRVELIEGEVIDMPAIGTRHASTVNRLTRLLTTAFGDTAIVAVQNPVRLGDYSEPQPDLLLLRPRTDFYASAHPTPADVLLLIEVADSSARYDREIKVPLYARHGVVEVWIVDLDARQVRFFRSPQGDTYADVTVTEAPGPTPLVAWAEVHIDLSAILG